MLASHGVTFASHIYIRGFALEDIDEHWRLIEGLAKQTCNMSCLHKSHMA